MVPSLPCFLVILTADYRDWLWYSKLILTNLYYLEWLYNFWFPHPWNGNLTTTLHSKDFKLSMISWQAICECRVISECSFSFVFLWFAIDVTWTKCDTGIHNLLPQHGPDLGPDQGPGPSLDLDPDPFPDQDPDPEVVAGLMLQILGILSLWLVSLVESQKGS